MTDFGSETWFGKTPEDVPLLGLDQFSDEVFASYTGPEDGLGFVFRDSSSSIIPSNTYIEAAGVKNWNIKDQKAYGICISLYEQHPVNGKMSGDPIADAFALCARKNNCILLIADGVNWGEKSRLAARCALYGAMKYLNRKLFQERQQPQNTQEALVLLRQAFDAAHSTILDRDGGLTTMCACMVCPVKNSKQFAVCCVNVGDSYGYLFSHRYGIRELTIGSHDITSERDIRDAGGAIGPVCGNNPELQNLTCSLSFCEAGDIVFLTTDGISDNFDPVVTKAALPRKINDANSNELSPNSMDSGKPEMEPSERHLYAMKQMERVVYEFELVTEEQCSAQELCGALVQHVLRLTDAKRKILENPQLYVRRRLTQKEKEKRDSDIVNQMGKAPGKLDHASIVAFEVGIMKRNEEEMESIPLIETVQGLESVSESEECPSSSGPLSPTHKKSRPRKLFARIKNLSVNTNGHSSSSPVTSPKSAPVSPRKFSFKRSRSKTTETTSPISPEPTSPSDIPSPSLVSPSSVFPVPAPRRKHRQASRESSV
ncbi:uncharacterized protein LOC133188134 [Saccostrea echinata]|uniref:uncharacterized protein LOC133188134 n=1 Tax=Saccostrea echinata TaxID=191078 RepID=UPI002A7F0945|nr:uncharacterized protein LOC133188134 [Saccostrea echinata]